MTNQKLEAIKTMMNEIDSQAAKTSLAAHPMAIEEFAKLIDDDEKIVFFNIGFKEKKNRAGMIFVTNKRFILCLKLILPYVEQFSYDAINSVDYTKNFFGQYIIEINSYGNKSRYNYTYSTQFIDMINYIRTRMVEVKQQSQVSVQSEAVDVISQLERLAKLKTDGILTQEEFDSQKAKLLCL